MILSRAICVHTAVLTTNVPLSSWGTILNSTTTAEAILYRLVYHSHVIKIKGKWLCPYNGVN
ncbi:ATP-binding protein [Ligilactobacillus ruminis]|uniref:ATP-binding protein n=1 Tax=Ligilactobacillus ruminis TaxID=1623 RepID=UPI003F953B5E